MTTLTIAARNLVAQRKRYRLLAIAVAVGYALVTLMTGLSGGLVGAAEGKASVYFSGDASVTGHRPDFTRGIADVELVGKAVRASGIPARLVSSRSIYYEADAKAYFGFSVARLRRVVGVDFSAERDEFARMKLVAGSVPEGASPDAIVISSTAAKVLGCGVGDGVTLEMRRDDGSLGTGTFAVAAIFDEPGFFGYAAYADAEGLNAALGRPEGARTDVAVFLGPGMSRADATERLRTSLGELAPTFPALDSKAALGALWRKGIDRETFSVISLDANLAEIRDFIDALRAVTLAALAVFLVVIAAGVLSTYRIVVRERTGEIGTMRAMGMSRAGVASTFFWEAVGVSALGCVAGFAAGLGLSALASTLDLSRYAPLAMLLVDGRPSPAWDPLALAASFGIVCACAVLAATGPAWKTASLEPATALQGVKR